jgi:cytochrome c peroxidase
MSLRRFRILLGGLALLTGMLVLASCGGGKKLDLHKNISKQLGFDPHANLVIPRAQMQQILNAVSAKTADTPNVQLVSQGKDLFFSRTLAKQGASCASCHTEASSNADLGTILHPRNPTDFTGPRTAIPLWNVAQTAPYLWSGNVATLQTQTVNVVKTFFKAGATQPAATTGAQAAGLIAYMNTLKPPTSAFDLGTMSASAINGEKIFGGKGKCAHCHGGPLFTDQQVHNTCVPKVAGETDPGNTTQPADVQKNPGCADTHAFDNPQLRDVAARQSFMHNGVFTSLEQVVDFYDQTSSIAPLGLSPQEKTDLVNFMKAL